MPAGAVERVLTQVRVGRRLIGLLRHPIASSAGFTEDLRVRLAHRAEHFLRQAEHLIFSRPESPYRPLFALAGYDLAKLRALVAARGLDEALDQLRVDGVFVRLQEFKGTEPAVRRGQTLRFDEKDFRNPSVTPLLHARSSGARSRGTASPVSVEDLLEVARLRLWFMEQTGLADRDIIAFTGSAVGSLVLAYALAGRPPRRWFTLTGHHARPRSAEHAVVGLLSGVRLPRPEPLPADGFVTLARFISRASASRGLIVHCWVTAALRLVLAAEEAGIALGDVVFWTGGEPLTPVKRRQIEQRGFRVIPSYSFSEFGMVGLACPVPRQADDLHVLTHKVAVRPYPRLVDTNGARVPAFLFTSLHPHTRHVMVNVESGDYGELEERSCGCFLDQAGLPLHIHSIRSFEKLTAEGRTFLGTDIVDLLEDILPREFGGDSRHYQLVEGEDERGITRLYVLASPRLGAIDETALRRTVLREIGLRQSGPAVSLAVAGVWQEAETVQVLRRDPLVTPGGKILHLHRDRGELQADGDLPDGGGAS